jgi:type IV pilus biogenesis protein CpaD/CtpE
MKINTTVLQALTVAVALQTTACTSEPPKQCNKPTIISNTDSIDIDTIKIKNKPRRYSCPTCGLG